ncbi:MAG: hypothetical protein A2Z24_01470 [Candidatus Woykebacteria bacterium RBG_16_44_10]|uniref:Beta propeller domain-containing protein n=1 Tax=Candidatus Woykebacteria bacterium RBG_16_44_10 TaxID=1802597 RepID=A0A1G1WET7_9BACT|nr:MAG: hypothetical protein A2Z24_01470 [Candidatus Woykebacteria bacterium RBG_16_44_10]
MLVLLSAFLILVLYKRPSTVVPITGSTPLPVFKSCSQLANTLEKAAKSGRSYSPGIEFSAPTTRMSAPKEAVPDYSQTNVQVAGVDEADIVKTDGEYIYTLSDKNVVISKAYPPDEAAVVSKIDYDASSNPQEIFVRNDSVLVFGGRYLQTEERKGLGSSVSEMPYYYGGLTFVEIWDISNREKPKLERKIEFEGTYVSSRKIDQYVYFVLNSTPSLQEESEQEDDILPRYRDQKGASLNQKDEQFKPVCGCGQVSYIEPIVQTNYINLIALDMDHPEKEIEREVVLGSAQNLYSSFNNIYLANTYYNWTRPVFLGPASIYPKDEESTYIYKFSLSADKVGYFGQTKVPGTILNQFSMDEYEQNFRIATTKGHVAKGGGTATNNIYILDKNLNQVGAIENIAPGEKIYSARFMGKRGYLVTFKKVDPFFVFDLSDPTNPKILGKLKIPGYSDYLHPYDENHVIGLGKNTVEAEEGDFAWYQGIKIALFDVSDVSSPKEKYKVEIGDRGTDSYALNDHKAFLFSREKSLLVIPVLLAEIDPKIKSDPDYKSNTHGDYVYQGAYVYSLSLNEGFNLKGRVTHYEDDDVFKKSGYYYYGDDLSVKRSLYIDGYLYTVSGEKISINSLDNLSLIKQITF